MSTDVMECSILDVKISFFRGCWIEDPDALCLTTSSFSSVCMYLLCSRYWKRNEDYYYEYDSWGGERGISLFLLSKAPVEGCLRNLDLRWYFPFKRNALRVWFVIGFWMGMGIDKGRRCGLNYRTTASPTLLGSSQVGLHCSTREEIIGGFREILNTSPRRKCRRALWTSYRLQ